MVLHDKPHIPPVAATVGKANSVMARVASTKPGAVSPMISGQFSTLPPTNIAPENGWLEY